MKSLSLVIATLLFFVIISCNKATKNARIYKDCSGSYIRFEGNDYRVCNLESVAGFENGKEVYVTFKKIKKCNGSANDAEVCAILHDNAGWVEIKKIK
jgi:hypothetical protein